MASRWAAVWVVLALCLGAYVAARTAAVLATGPSPGTISTYAGGPASGLATKIPQHPFGLALNGSTLYVGDFDGGVVRAVDLVTGLETVVAGNGDTSGNTGDGGSATAASIYVPQGLAISGANLYIASSHIRKVDLNTGIITTVAGGGNGPIGDGGPATSATVYAAAVAVDKSGNLIIADTGNNRIRRIDHATGTITTIAGTGVAGFSGDGGPAVSATLNGPSDLWVDGAGSIWIGDYQNHRLRKVVGGTIDTVAGNGAADNNGCSDGVASGPLDPIGAWVDSSGNAFITEGSCIKELTGTTMKAIAGGGTSSGDGQPPLQTRLYAAQRAIEDGAGNLYISDNGNARLRKVPSGGNVVTIAGTGGPCVLNTSGQASAASLCDPQGLATDSAGDLFIAETRGNVVEKITPAGAISVVAGNGQYGYSGDNGPATSAQLNSPIAVAVDGSGNLLIADSNNSRIRKVDSAGVITTLALVNYPEAMALDSAGNIFLADTDAEKVFKVTSGGVVSTFAGTGTPGFSGDGGPATSAQLFYPRGVAVDALGNVYINDMLNQRIRKIDPGGTITTLTVTGHLSQIGPGGQLAVTPGGAVVVAGGVNTETVTLITPSGNTSTAAGTGTLGFSGDGGPAISAQLNEPLAVALDPSGNLYIADNLNHRIRRVEAYGAPSVPTAVTATAGFDQATVRWTAPANSGGLPVIEYAVTQYVGAAHGLPVVVAGSPPVTSLVVPALTPGVHYRFTVSASNGWSGSGASPLTAPIAPLTHAPAGTVVTRAGAVGVGAAVSIGQAPYSLALAGTHVYVGDFGNAVVRDVDTVIGQESVLAGNAGYGLTGNGGPAVAAMIQGAGAIANCGPGLFYFADTYNFMIRRIDAAGKITSVAGDGLPGYTGDGGPATSAKLGRVFGLACRTGGGLYISDSDNGAVRVLDTNGKIRTWWHGFGFPTGIVELGTLDNVAVSDAGGDSAVWHISNGPRPSVIAGSPGHPGYGGDNGAAALSMLNDPRGLAFTMGGGGELYIADRGNNRVRLVDSGGFISTLAGTGVAGFSGDNGQSLLAELNQPSDVAINGNSLYVADSANFRVRHINLAGGLLITTIAGNGTPSRSGDGGPGIQAQLGAPYAVAVDAAGNEYIADDQNATIRKIDTNGVITSVAGTGIAGFSGDGGSATSAQLNDPRGVAVNPGGDLFISDTGNQRIRMVDHASGFITTVAGTGTAGYSGDNGDASAAMINYPRAVAVDAGGNLYIADTANNRVRKVDAAGIITTVAGNGVAGYGGDGTPATSANLSGPRGLVFDGAGNLFIGDTDNNRVREVDHVTGVITTFAGTGVAGLTGDGGAATMAELDYPFGLAFDANGRLYIADTLNQRVRQVDAQGNIFTVVAACGTAPGLSGDGGPASNAQLNYPFGLGADAVGNVFIADINNNRVRVVYGLGGGGRDATCPSPAGTPGSRAANGSPAIGADIVRRPAALQQSAPGSAALKPAHPVLVIAARPPRSAPVAAPPAVPRTQPVSAKPAPLRTVPPRVRQGAAPGTTASAPPAQAHAPLAIASPEPWLGYPVLAALLLVALILGVAVWRRRRATTRPSRSD